MAQRGRPAKRSGSQVAKSMADEHNFTVKSVEDEHNFIAKNVENGTKTTLNDMEKGQNDSIWEKKIIEIENSTLSDRAKKFMISSYKRYMESDVV